MNITLVKRICGVSFNLVVTTVVCLSLFAQTKGDARPVPNVVAETLKDFLKYWERQSNVVILYSDNDIHSERIVFLSKNAREIEYELDRVLLPIGLKWRYVNGKAGGKIVVFSEKNEYKYVIDSLKSISGKVLSEDGQVLIGVSLQVKGKNVGTMTDNNGRFILNDLGQGDLLVITYLGYERHEFRLNNERDVLIRMRKKSSQLDEKVVIGYGTTTRRNSIGSISKVSGSEIVKQPVVDPILALQGRVAGLFISRGSGIPGGSVDISLRGRNSIANDNFPLYIVDGVPFQTSTLTNMAVGQAAIQVSPFNSLNPMDIESVEVLKDADATAIYGARGANGVILITTKRGRVGKTEVGVNIYKGVGMFSRRLDLLSLDEYLMMRKEAFYNDGVAVPQTAYDVNGKWDTTKSTDWQEFFLGNKTSILNAQISISGGAENTKFSLQGGYSRETAFYPIKFPFGKKTIHLAVDNTSANKKLAVGISAGATNLRSLMPLGDPGRGVLLAPNAPAVYDAQGNLNWEDNTWTNPLSVLLRHSDLESNILYGNLNIGYKILKGFDAKVSMGYNSLSSEQSNITPLSSYAPSFSTVTSFRQHNFSVDKNSSWILEPQLNYRMNIDKVEAEYMVGATFQSKKLNSLSQFATGFSDDKLIPNVAAASRIFILGSTNYDYRYLSIFGRVGLNFDRRFFLNINVRRDGSSRFGSGRRFGNFGALGVGWIFSNESFLKESNILTFGKIRSSYGAAGSEPTTDYQYLSKYEVLNDPYLGVTGFYPANLTNRNYRWEKVKKLEFGLDLGFFKDRILLNVDLYRNLTDNQLVGYTLPYITGFDGVQANLPATIKNTGLEVELSTRNFEWKDISWKSSANISFPRNKLISFPGLSNSTYAASYVVGEPLILQRRYMYTGVDSENGTYLFEDVNKDGLITATGDRTKIVSTAPRFHGGINNDISIKNFKIDFLLQFANKKSADVYSFIPSSPGWFNLNQPKSVLDRWRKLGDDAGFQKFTQRSGAAATAYANVINSDFAFVNSSYVRLKSMSISYYLPSEWVKRCQLGVVRFYLEGSNLLTITRYRGLDPEVLGFNHPPIKMYTGGVQISL